MLWEWKNRQPITLEGKTYDVWAISPTFTTPLGTYPPPNYGEDYWGKGTAGEQGITVDYQTTSTAFWKIMEDHRPIAIMSYSRWAFNKQWALDAWGTNWARDQGKRIFRGIRIIRVGVVEVKASTEGFP